MGLGLRLGLGLEELLPPAVAIGDDGGIVVDQAGRGEAATEGEPWLGLGLQLGLGVGLGLGLGLGLG